MPSEHGKFRTIVVNDAVNENVMTIGHLDRMKNALQVN